LVNAFDGAVARLKSIDMQGYKTFANRTDLVFSPTVTAIVGPNGSGKSNIADAIRWVLGEQAYSLLRGKRTEDMIFSGSEERPRASMASVEITFDNSDGWLPIEFSEVSIGRRAYRDGQNEYLLNGQRVRLRDVSELLAKCGLAERTYTIIGQGLVDAALSLRADERRQLFEEAAGIGLYRSRRDEALRRLDTTRRNLDRVQDILAELRPRLRSLERQVKRAKDYEQVKQDLDDSLRQWYGFHWYRLIDKVQHARLEAEAHELNRDDLRRQQDDLEADMRRTRERIDALRAQLSSWSQQSSDLYRQREAAGRRLAVAQERKNGLAEQQTLVRTELEALNQERGALASQLQAAQLELDQRNQTLSEARAQLEELLAGGAIGTRQRREMQDKIQSLRSSLKDLTLEQATWQAQKGQLETQINRLTDELETAESGRAETKQALEVARQEADQAQQSYEMAQKTLGSAEDAVKTKELELAEAEREHAACAGHVAERSGALSALQARVEQLEGEDADVEKLAVRLKEDQGAGKYERIADEVEVGSDYRVAIRAALGEFAKSLAMPSGQSLLQALDWWDKHGSNEQLALVAAEELRQPPKLDMPDDRGVIGLASDQVKAPSHLQSIVDHLLSRVIIVQDRAAARRLLDKVPHDVRLVTLNGEVHYQGGQVVVGWAGSDARRAQTRRQLQDDLRVRRKALQEAEEKQELAAERLENEERTLRQAKEAVEQGRESQLEARATLQARQLELAESQREADRKQALIDRLQAELAGLQEQLAQLAGQGSGFEDRRSRLEASITELEDKVQRAETSVEVTRAESALEAAQQAVSDAAGPVQDLEGRQRDLDAEIASWQRRLEASQDEEMQLAEDIQTASREDREIEQTLTELQELVQPAERSLSEAEAQRSTLEDEEARIRVELSQAERVHSQSQIELARREEELSSMRRRIEDDFGLVTFDEDETASSQEPLPLEGLVEKLPRVSDIPDELEGQVNRLRVQLRRMGTVNPEARREHREVKERTEFLVSQVDDLRKAEDQIQEVIAELDLLMEREFRVTFEEVAIAFRDMFTRLFGGGSARLVLTNPDDLTDSGIDIEARLPGRREQGLSMLSGGERSLTASALIFALLKVSPTPFCLLDEVDAMLDEANVLRFGDVLAELSRLTQFIVITHNRQTVQAAEAIYGVTMGDDSVSRLISLKLDEYEKEMAEA
jgi:chromosome segregation protein